MFPLFKELMNECLSRMSQLNVRPEIKTYRVTTGYHFSSVNSGLNNQIYQKVADLNIESPEKCLDKIIELFYTLIIHPIIGEYYMNTKKVDLSEDEIHYFMYDELYVIFLYYQTVHLHSRNV